LSIKNAAGSLGAVVVLGLVVVLGGTALAQSSNSELGTWKLNLAKSKVTSGPVPKSQTLKYQAAGAGMKAIVDLVSDDGTVRHYEYSVNYDGKDNPIIGHSPNGNMTARTRVHGELQICERS
jgi:hypothetical protein